MTNDREVDEAVIITEYHDVAEVTRKSGVDAGLDNVESIAKYSDLEGRMAEFEEQMRRDPQDFSPLPREADVPPRRRTGQECENLSTFSRFFPLAEAAMENRQRYGALAFMAMEHDTGSRRGEKRQKVKVKRQKYCGGGRRRTFELPASCRVAANAEGRAASIGNPTDIREF